MQEQSNLSRLKSLLLTSVWVIPVFLVIPAYSIINLRLHHPFSGNLLLWNNACFALFLGIRCVYYLTRLGAKIRYGAERCVPASSRTVQRPAEEIKAGLSGAGYRFDEAGRYGEKRDLGYLGTAIIYGGLMIALMVGSYDFMREYSIMVRLGVGLPIPLDGKGLTGQYEAGPLAATAKLPLLQVKQQILPNEKYPKGATEINLTDEKGKVLAHTFLAPGKPFYYGGLDYHMIQYLFDGLLVIREGKYIIFDEFIKFLPLAQKKDEYSYVAQVTSKESSVHGQALLNPEKKKMNIIAKLGAKDIFVGDLELWGVHKKDQGNYQASWDGMAQWSELRVARARHRGLLGFGVAAFLFGVALRLLFRPQRVWVEPNGGSTEVKVCGSLTERLVAGAAKG